MTNKAIIITAPVLIPYTPDCEYQYGEEVLPPEKIEQLANSFNQYKIIDLQHEFTKRLINKQKPIPRGKLLKSYITQEKLYLKGLDGFVREYPPGTWIITVKITDPEAIRLYNNGELTGVSITVKEKDHADTIIEFLDNHDIPYLPEHIVEAEKGFYKKPKRILMKDVINPVAFTVSLVKSPCVYDAKFCKNSCVIVNQDKLKEKKILNLKEKIKKEINSFIDGLDVEEESVKEDVGVEESEKQEVSSEESQKETETESEESQKGSSEKCDGKTKTIYGRKVKVQSTKSETEEESQKDDGDSGDGDGDPNNAGSGEGSDSGDGANLDGDGGEVTPTGGDDSEPEPTSSEQDKNVGNGGKGNGKKEVVEAKKEDVTESTESESDKDVLYLAQDDVENLISTTLRRYAEEVEQMVFDGIQEALDDYLFSQDISYKEDVESEKEEIEETESEKEEVEEESQKQYATPDMVKSMFDEQFSSFKSSIMDSIKQAQKESIKSYSKAITSSDDGFQKESKKETFKPKVERDFNGCRIRKRQK